MRKSEMDDKTPVERLRSFLEIEDDEIAQMSPDEVHDELRLLGINPDRFSAELNARVSDLLSDSECLKSSISKDTDNVRAEPDLLHDSWSQKIGNVVLSFFQFFSKTDQAVLASCSTQAISSQTSMGLMVLLSGVLAALSGTYAIHMMISPSTVLALVGGVLYGAIMLAIDRELVSFSRKTSVLPRLVLAIFVGMVISAPLELKFFESRINEELAQTREEQAKAIWERTNQADNAYDAKMSNLQRDITEYREGIARSMDAMTGEVLGQRESNRTGVAGAGPVYREAQRLKENYERLLRQAETQMEEMHVARQQQIDIATKEASIHSLNMAGDLLSRLEALGRIAASSRTAFYAVWAFRLFMVLIQILPILLYLFTPTNDYMAIVEAERRKAIARIHAIANAHLDEIRNDPYSTSVPKIYVGFGSSKTENVEQYS